MKKVYFILAAVILISGVFLSLEASAQLPQKMNLQTIIRDTSNNMVANQSVGMRVSILQGSTTGPIVYQEIYNPNPKTNAIGLVSIEIGSGKALLGTFSTISWENGPYFIKIETDLTGGTTYTVTRFSQI